MVLFCSSVFYEYVLLLIFKENHFDEKCIVLLCDYYVLDLIVAKKIKGISKFEHFYFSSNFDVVYGFELIMLRPYAIM
jgi:hypothetical protein